MLENCRLSSDVQSRCVVVNWNSSKSTSYQYAGATASDSISTWRAGDVNKSVASKETVLGKVKKVFSPIVCRVDPAFTSFTIS